MADLNSADILGVDWARRARELLAGAQTSVPKEKAPPEMWRGGTFRLEPVEIREKNVFTDPDSWLNRGLGTIWKIPLTLFLAKALETRLSIWHSVLPDQVQRLAPLLQETNLGCSTFCLLVVL